MVWKSHDYDDIPGTYVFDGGRSHKPYALNKMFYSFNQAQNREEFDRDPAAYCDKYGVKDEFKAAVIAQDYLGMLRLGANIYFMAKMAVPRGVSVQDAGAQFQGITTEEFMARLLAKREEFERRIAQKEDYWNG